MVGDKIAGRFRHDKHPPWCFPQSQQYPITPGMEITVWPSATGINSGGQVNILGTFPKGRLKDCLFALVLICDTVADGKKMMDS